MGIFLLVTGTLQAWPDGMHWPEQRCVLGYEVSVFSARPKHHHLSLGTCNGLVGNELAVSSDVNPVRANQNVPNKPESRFKIVVDI
jgi:hypothetical protein